jgi:HAD superfamily hydrolase (TIGR01549 family)
MYDAVIFDLDDTLLRTKDAKWAQHQWVAQEHYGFELTLADFHAHYGKPFNVMLGSFYGERATYDELVEIYHSSDQQFPKGIFEDAAEVIEKLSANGKLLGIVTATMSEWAVNDLERHGVPAHRFDFVHGAADCAFHKPDPRVFDKAFEHLNERAISRDRMVYVGDSLNDFFAARDAGIDFVGVTTGMATAEQFEDAGAETIATDLRAVLDAV